MDKQLNKQVKAILGDFQTPLELAREVIAVVATTDGSISAVVEPTCGVGSFLMASIEKIGPAVSYYGFDIKPQYVEQCFTSVRSVAPKVQVECQDFYEMDWKAFFKELPERVLVIGNPPWVTNASLGSMGGGNLPVKTNFQGHNGFAAKTGKANFDISEWMLIRLLEGLSGKQATLAMLCKTATARKVLRHAWRSKFDLGRSSVHLIDAARHFGVSVDACLLLTHTGVSRAEQRATAYKGLSFSCPVQTFGIVNGELVSDVDAFDELKDLDGIEYRRWRSGVKHDAYRVMELEKVTDGYRNGLGETYSLEPDYVFPLLKSSDLANSRLAIQRYVLLPQSRVSDDTASIEALAPRTWNYLQAHVNWFDSRGSSIYAKRARFAVFGVGPYTFSPWKVAIAGLYKNLRFQAIGSLDGRPVVVDDTCYFFPCESQDEAEFFACLLNSETAMRFLHSLVFFDSKRPITIDTLKRIDLIKLAEHLGQRQRAEDYLMNAPYEEGAQKMFVFERQQRYHANASI